MDQISVEESLSVNSILMLGTSPLAREIENPRSGMKFAQQFQDFTKVDISRWEYSYTDHSIIWLYNINHCTCTSGNFAHVICLPYLINMCNIYFLIMDYTNISCSTVLRVLYKPRSIVTEQEISLLSFYSNCNLNFTCSVLCMHNHKRKYLYIRMSKEYAILLTALIEHTIHTRSSYM